MTISHQLKKYSIVVIAIIFLTAITIIATQAYSVLTTNPTTNKQVKGAFEVIDSNTSLNNPVFVDTKFDFYTTLKENYSQFDTLIIPTFELQDNDFRPNEKNEFRDLQDLIKIKKINNSLLANFDFNSKEQASNFWSNPDNGQNLINHLAQLKDYKGANLNIDLRWLNSTELNNFDTWLPKLRGELKAQNKFLTISTSLESLNNENQTKLKPYFDRIFAQLWSDNSTSKKLNDYLTSLDFGKHKDNLNTLDPLKTTLILPTWNTRLELDNKGNINFREQLGFEKIINTYFAQDNIKPKIDYNQDVFPSFVKPIDTNNYHQFLFQDATSIINYKAKIKALSNNNQQWELGISNIESLEPTAIDQLKTQNPNSSTDTNSINIFKSTVRVQKNGQGSIINNIKASQNGLRQTAIKDGIITQQSIQKNYEVSQLDLSGIQIGKLALTFDDGPDPIYTPQVLDLLKEYNAKATFFVVGKKVKQYPDLIKRILSEGHQIENHSYSHTIMSNQDKLQSEIIRTDEALKTFGITSNYFRAPYNQFSNNSEVEISKLAFIQNLGKINVFDDYNGYDYLPNINGQEISNKILGQLTKNPGSIIVLHDSYGEMVKNRQETIVALKLILPELKSNNYDLVKISDLQQVPNNYTNSQTKPNSNSESNSSLQLQLADIELKNPLVEATLGSDYQQKESYSSLSSIYIISVATLFSVMIVSFVFSKLTKKIINF